jgi:hypothetical protein
MIGDVMIKVVTVEHVNTLLAEVANEERERRIAVEYYNMVDDLHQQYFAQMQADIDAGFLE